MQEGSSHRFNDDIGIERLPDETDVPGQDSRHLRQHAKEAGASYEGCNRARTELISDRGLPAMYGMELWGRSGSMVVVYPAE